MTRLRWDRARRGRDLVTPHDPRDLHQATPADVHIPSITERLPLPSGGWVQVRFDRLEGAHRYGLRPPRRDERRIGHATMQGLLEVLLEAGTVRAESRLSGQTAWRNSADWSEDWP